MIGPTIPTVLRGHAARRPDAVAFTHLDSTRGVTPITFAELVDRSAGYTSRFLERGARPGDVVLVILRHDPEMLFAFFGAMMAGLAPSILPFPTPKLDPEAYRISMAALIRRIEPRVLVTDADLAVHYTHLDVALLHPGLLDPPRYEDGTILVAEDDVALLQHSSGSTGLQKGVPLTHRQILAQIEHYADAISLLPSDVIVSWLPLYHDMGLIACMLLPVVRGIETIWMSPFDWVQRPSMLLEIVTERRPTLCWQPNFAFSLLGRKVPVEDRAGFDLSSMRAWINCSEPARAETMRVFVEAFGPCGVTDRALAVCYAMAENVFAVSQTEVGEPPRFDAIDRNGLARGVAVPSLDVRASISVSCGPAIDGTSLVVRDEKSNDLPERQVGQLNIRGSSCFGGYHGGSPAHEDGWFPTGDLGYVADGHVYVTGRVKDLIIIAGRNLYPQDIEALVGADHDVIDGRVAALGHDDGLLGTQRLIVLAETRLTTDRDRREATRRIRERVLTHTDGATLDVILVEPGRLLKTSSGKVARTANLERFVLTRS